MRNFSPKQMLLAWIAGGLIGIVSLAWLSLNFFAQRLRANAGNLLDAQVTIEANRRQQQNLSNLSKQVADIQSNAQELNRAFVDRTKALDFVEYIEATATKENVDQTFTPVEPARTAPPSQNQYALEEKGYTLTLKGKTPNLFRFLNDLETNPVYLLTTTISLSHDDTGNSTLNLQGTIPWH